MTDHMTVAGKEPYKVQTKTEKKTYLMVPNTSGYIFQVIFIFNQNHNTEKIFDLFFL